MYGSKVKGTNTITNADENTNTNTDDIEQKTSKEEQQSDKSCRAQR